MPRKRTLLAGICTVLFLALVWCPRLFTGSPYFDRRARDAEDIITLTFGCGLGAKVRMGPVHVGVLAMADLYGWRKGPIRPPGSGVQLGTIDLDWTLGCFQQLRGGFAATGGNAPQNWRGEEMGSWAKGWPMLSGVERLANREGMWFHPYYTEIESCLALLGGVRFGINPGELLDFVLGWFGVDIFKDDRIAEKAPAPEVWSDIDMAVLKHDIAAVKRCIRDDPTCVSSHRRGGGTPLHGAAVGEDTKLVDILIEAGANIDARDEFGYTPLMSAARSLINDRQTHEWRPNIVMVKHLLARGADPTAVDNEGHSVLWLASKIHGEPAISTLKAVIEEWRAKHDRPRVDGENGEKEGTQ